MALSHFNIPAYLPTQIANFSKWPSSGPSFGNITLSISMA